MNAYSLFHFEHKNDTKTIISLHRAPPIRFVALHKSLTIIVIHGISVNYTFVFSNFFRKRRNTEETSKIFLPVLVCLFHNIFTHPAFNMSIILGSGKKEASLSMIIPTNCYVYRRDYVPIVCIM